MSQILPKLILSFSCLKLPKASSLLKVFLAPTGSQEVLMFINSLIRFVEVWLEPRISSFWLGFNESSERAQERIMSVCRSPPNNQHFLSIMQMIKKKFTKPSALCPVSYLKMTQVVLRLPKTPVGRPGVAFRQEALTFLFLCQLCHFHLTESLLHLK